MKQVTFMMLKPDACKKHLEQVICLEIEKSGCLIEKIQRRKVSESVLLILKQHYQEVIQKMPPDFNFVEKLSHTFYHEEIVLMRVSYEGNQDIIELTRSLVGKTDPSLADKKSIRGKYSQDSYEKANRENRLVHNLIHAADSKKNAQKELKLWQMES